MSLDWEQAAPTGPSGRIIERDIIALSKSGNRCGAENAEGAGRARCAHATEAGDGILRTCRIAMCAV